MLSPILSRSLSASPLKGESVPLNIWEVGFIFELVYIIRTWKFVEIKCMRDWLCALCVSKCVCASEMKGWNSLNR